MVEPPKVECRLDLTDCGQRCTQRQRRTRRVHRRSTYHVPQRSNPADLLASAAWPLLVAARESGDATLIDKAKDLLRSIPTLG